MTNAPPIPPPNRAHARMVRAGRLPASGHLLARWVGIAWRWSTSWSAKVVWHGARVIERLIHGRYGTPRLPGYLARLASGLILAGLVFLPIYWWWGTLVAWLASIWLLGGMLRTLGLPRRI